MRLHLSTFYLTVIGFTLFSRCGLFDRGSDHIAGDYYLTWIDTHNNRFIHKKDGEGVVSKFVFAVGHNEKFIWAKQAPYKRDDREAGPQSKIFFIIERTDHFVQDKPVYGPLNQMAFDSLCRQLHILNPQFDLDYSDLLKAY